MTEDCHLHTPSYKGQGGYWGGGPKVIEDRHLIYLSSSFCYVLSGLVVSGISELNFKSLVDKLCSLLPSCGQGSIIRYHF